MINALKMNNKHSFVFLVPIVEAVLCVLFCLDLRGGPMSMICDVTSQIRSSF